MMCIEFGFVLFTLISTCLHIITIWFCSLLNLGRKNITSCYIGRNCMQNLITVRYGIALCWILFRK